jgi:putative holliday junction resolvase
MKQKYPPVTLAIDFGTKRIGLAVSRATLAEPLRVLLWPKTLPELALDQILNEISNFCRQELIQQILVGVSEGDMAQKSKDFGEQLAKKVSLPVLYADETLSSQNATAKIRILKKSKRSGAIDHYAAAEFLQEYLQDFKLKSHF